MPEVSRHAPSPSSAPGREVPQVPQFPQVQQIPQVRQVAAICICLDDFGWHDGVNEAALTLHRMGRVHALSCLVGAPAWRRGAESLRRDWAGPIDVGLHLDLTDFPITRPAQSWPSLWFRGGLGRLSAQALRAEISAQLQAFEKDMGRRPDFVDGHRHVHQFPQVREALMDVLLQRYAYYKPWIRCTRPGRWSWRWSQRSGLVGGLGAHALAQEAQVLAFPQNRSLLGAYDFKGGPDRYRRRFAGWLGMARSSDLLMCHASARWIPGDSIAQARMDEFQVLADPAFDGLVRAQALRLVAMSRILDDERLAMHGRTA